MKKETSVKLRLGLYGLLALGLIFIMIFGEQIAPYDPYKNNYTAIDVAPCAEHIMGTDALGRDLFSRILTGAKSSLLTTLIVVAATGVIGTVAGVTAGYFGGIVDVIIQKILLIVQSFPGQVLAIAVAGVLGAGTGNAALALIAIGWIAEARLARSLVLKIKNSNYIKAAKLCGCGPGYIITFHIIPNISKMMIVSIMLSLSGTMMELSSLAFLGLSAKPPYPEWGFMMSEGRKVLMTSPWQALMPGLAILTVVIILNRLGDSVQDYLDFAHAQVD